MSRTDISNYQVERKFGPFFTGDYIELSKDAKHIYCQSSDSIKVVEVDSSKVIHSLSFEDDEIVCLSLSPDLKTLVAATKSHTIHQFTIPDDIESNSPSLVRKFKSFHNSAVTSLAWDSSSTFLATGSADGTARVWNITQKFCTHNIKMCSGVVRNLTFSSDLKTLPWLICSTENIIYLFELLHGSTKLIAKFEDSHHSAITKIILVESQKKLISCGLDKVIVLWNLDEFKVEKVIPTFESMLSLLLVPLDNSWVEKFPQTENSGLCVMAIGEKGILQLWDVTNVKCLWRSKESVVTKFEECGGIAIIKDMRLVTALDSIMITTYEHVIMFLQVGSMLVQKQLTGNNDQIYDACFIGENDTHLAVASNSALLRVYDSSTLSCQFLRGHSSNVISLTRHPTVYNIFASGSHDNSALLWKMGNGVATCIARAEGHTHSINSLAFGKDFLITGSIDTCMKKWNLNIAALTKESDNGSVPKLTSSITEKAHDNDINSVCVSANSKFIATASQDKSAKLWDGQSLSHYGTLRGHRRGIWFIQFSPVDQLVATSSADGCIKIWVLQDLSNVTTLEGHSVSVLRFCWINEGTQILSSATDGLIKLWSVKKGLCVNTFDEHDTKVWALCSSEDGQKIVSAGEDSTIVWWKDITEEEQIKNQEEKQKLEMQNQLLQNLLKDKKWSKALLLSIKLAQPYRSLSILKELLDEDPSMLPSVLNKLSLPKLMSLLEFAIQWNTKTMHVRESQSILQYVLQRHTLDELETMPEWKEIIECLLPYTERHFKRVSVLSQSSNIIDFIVSNNSVSLLS